MFIKLRNVNNHVGESMSSTQPLARIEPLEKTLGRIFHYLIHRKSIVQYFHELKHAKNKEAFSELVSRAVLEARRDRDSGDFTGFIPSGDELVKRILEVSDEEVRSLVKAVMLRAVSYDPECEECRRGRGGEKA